MPNEFAVVGDHRENAAQLLVIGLDGRFYDYDPARGQPTPVEVDEHWVLFENPADVLDGVAPPPPSPA